MYCVDLNSALSRPIFRSIVKNKNCVSIDWKGAFLYVKGYV